MILLLKLRQVNAGGQKFVLNTAPVKTTDDGFLRTASRAPRPLTLFFNSFGGHVCQHQPDFAIAIRAFEAGV